jgi:metal-responsive CopG/Arc/MetJ family transcriptional regulator
VSIDEHKKSFRGRPKVDSEMIRSRLQRRLLDRLDAWIARQPEPKPSRPEAIRRLIEKALASK